MTTEELLLAACAALPASSASLADELEDLAGRFRRLRDMGHRDRRRGFALPLAWVNYLDGVPDATAAAWPWAVPS